jgi:phosphoribosylamine---glycine ligase
MKSLLIVGSGAREHALAWKLRQSPDIEEIYVAPGNPGTARLAHNVPVAAVDLPGIRRLVREKNIHLTIVGPEAPLALGLSDCLQADGHLVVGPTAAAARIESSKSFAKDLMRRANVPTAWYRVFDDPDVAHHFVASSGYPLVIKADGLASGKGVVVCQTLEEARRVIDDVMVQRIHGESGNRIVVEECLSGPEVSLMALVDGKQCFPLPLSQDHKRLGDGDTGPNTGGMGAYAPALPSLFLDLPQLVRIAMEPVVQTLIEMGTPYRGILYAGLMLTGDGPKVLEFNCRFGDPETQVLMPLIDGDLLPYLEAVAVGSLERGPQILPLCTTGVVLAAPGYPENPQLGSVIHGLPYVPEDILVFHAGTGLNEVGEVVTAGGRVLTVVGSGRDLLEALERAYGSPLWFDGMQFRGDIGWQAKGLPAGESQSEPELVYA